MTTISSVVSMSMGLRSLGSRMQGNGSTLSGASAAPSTQPSAGAVDYTERIKASGDKRIDTLLAGKNRWFHVEGASGAIPSEGARHELTYSFIGDASGLNSQDANGFQALDASQQSRVGEALSYLSTVIDVRFTEVASGGNIQYGSNTQGSSSGYARYPNEGSQVMLANNQQSFNTDWSKGTYEWEVVLHETAHALGLKHPGSYNAGGGKTPGPYLSAGQDNRSNTLMSYKQASHLKRVTYEEGAFSRSYVNSQSYQINDIMALQYLYGAAETQATTFQWNPGEIFSQTIYNTHADSVIDLSNQTLNNLVDLRAGRFSSIAQRDAYADMPFTQKEYAALKSGGKKISSLLGTPGYTGKNNLGLAVGSQIDRAIGGSGNDSFVANNRANTLDGGAGNDRFFLTSGSATLKGGEGDDTVFLKKKAGAVWRLSEDRSSLALTSTNKKTQETTTLASVSLEDIEHVKYWDGSSLKASGSGLLAGATGSNKLKLKYAPPAAAGIVDTSA